MKQSFLLLVTLAVIGTACNPKSLVIHSGYAPNYTHLYNTYCIAFDPITAEDTTLQHDIITAEINRQMQVRGFQYTTQNPDMLVFYSLHPDKIKLNTYVKSYRYPEVDYVVDKAFLRKGTLLIQFQDTFMNKTVWQGYAARVSPEGFFDKKAIRTAARNVLLGYHTFSLTYQAQNRERSSF
ncbi:DUF4136 domain-containing protein [Siphonobacter aquaeclarae]|jgi:hypothetical protein|uniref:DUF4136 domain-containing protein n=1 Tax=Siphonobacter aquaeclarae TaxID=563176 RepID=A0A1G9WDP2_9BACT|nr:DUF4136 domain-containing protein [Siphonobacter aquaeclarae]MBO9640345.1 DUF4136 domain-containing protein [Siphonobacter aquaeclarae]SDM82662.1 protein of unknown function [Siphonobacter aquaeclarae]